MCHYYYSCHFNDWNKGWNLQLWYTCVIFFIFYLILTVVYINLLLSWFLFFSSSHYNFYWITACSKQRLVNQIHNNISSNFFMISIVQWPIQTREGCVCVCGGGDHLDPEIRRGPCLQQKFLWPFRPQFGIKSDADGVSHRCKWHYILQWLTLTLVH